MRTARGQWHVHSVLRNGLGTPTAGGERTAQGQWHVHSILRNGLGTPAAGGERTAQEQWHVFPGIEIGSDSGVLD